MPQCLWGRSATRLRCYGAYAVAAAKLLPAPAGLGAPVPARLSGRLGGGHPSPLLIHLDPVPLGKGEMPGVALGLAVPSIAVRHPPASQHRRQGRAGEKQHRALSQPGEMLLNLPVPHH